MLVQTGVEFKEDYFKNDEKESKLTWKKGLLESLTKITVI